MNRFFCFGKKDFCDEKVCPMECAYCDGSGGEYRDDYWYEVERIIGSEYDLNHLLELVEADRDGRIILRPKDRAYTDEEIAEITGYKCPICANHKLCCTPHMKPLCGEVYDHFSPLAQSNNKNGLGGEQSGEV